MMDTAADGRSLYFAYGSNMDRSGMADRCPGARRVGTARLDGFEFRINGNHHATVVPAAGKVVYGVVWSITPADRLALDAYEGVEIALYRRDNVRVELDGGRVVTAMTYVARNTRATPTHGAYFDLVLGVARREGFPQAYLDELEQWRADGALP